MLTAPRITLKPFVPTFPCFANAEVSLMEKVSGYTSLYYDSFYSMFIFMEKLVKGVYIFLCSHMLISG